MEVSFDHLQYVLVNTLSTTSFVDLDHLVSLLMESLVLVFNKLRLFPNIGISFVGVGVSLFEGTIPEDGVVVSITGMEEREGK